MILECLSVRGVVSKKDCQIYFDEESMTEVESLAVDFGYIFLHQKERLLLRKNNQK